MSSLPPDPTNGDPSSSTDGWTEPYGTQPPPMADAYPPPGGGQGAPGGYPPPGGGYGAPGGYPPPGQGYGAPGGYPPPGYGAAPGYGYGYSPGPFGPQDHPDAVTVVILGALGIFFCQLLGIGAWVMGNKALREIDADPSRYGNRGTVQAGRIMGMISVGILVLFFVIMASIVIIALAGTS